jgi:aryl-alcohol dehydrogenase-like predicted oxidoreductase
MKLDEYLTLGRSGLRISPLGLGTMTFGTDWGWGADHKDARALFDRYVDAGGNFVDTADGYTSGKSEEMLGQFIRERGLRDRLVLATKFSFNAEAGNPNAGGNGRKNIYRALEGSLRRLQTDYVDLYWLHAWDRVTPVEEVVATLDDLVRAGKVRHIGLSDVPAWYAARFHTLAEQSGRERLCALQLEYSLVERSIEREHIPMAQALGLGVLSWSPLASGFLAGKYQRAQGSADGVGAGRLDVVKNSGNPGFAKFTEKNWQILDVCKMVAAELGRTPAEVALAWVIGQPGITSTLIGATKPAQLDSNLRALELGLPPALRAKLDEVSKLAAVHPYVFFDEFLQGMIHGGVTVRSWSPSTQAQP